MNSPDDLGVARRLHNLDELQARARAANARLLQTERAGQGCVFDSPAFARISQPSLTGDGRRAPGLRFGDPRVRALAGALAHTSCAVTGITNKSLRALMTGLLGAVEWVVPFQLACQAIAVTWYAAVGHDPPDAEDHRARAPWYITKVRPSTALPASAGDRKREMWGLRSWLPGFRGWLSLLRVPDSCRVLRAGRAGQRGAQRPRSGAPGALDATVRERIMPGGRGRGPLVADMVQRFRPVVFLCGVISRGGRGRARSSQPYLGPRGAGAAPAT